MPCYRCRARQVDPARGASPWKRGVLGGEQVLVCPDCQREHDWAAELDRCPACGSVQLAKALGATTCRSCGAATGGETAASAPAEGLADDVAAALARLRGRTRGR